MDKYSTPEVVAAAFRNFLKSRGYTFKHAAEVAGVTPSALSMQLKGRYMPYKSAKAFAKAFGLSIDYLLEGVGQIIAQSDTSTARNYMDAAPKSTQTTQRKPIQSKENFGEAMHELQLIELLVRELSLKVDRLQRDVDYLKTTPIGD